MLSRKEVWLEVQAERVACPRCGRVVSRKCLRWRHACRGPVMVDEEKAEEHREQLRAKSLAAAEERLPNPAR